MTLPLYVIALNSSKKRLAERDSAWRTSPCPQPPPTPCYDFGSPKESMFPHLIHAVVALLAITNPIAATPMFAAISEGMTKAQKTRAILSACLMVLVILGGSAFVGMRVLNFLGVQLDAFRFGGGLIIVLMGLEMLRGHISKVHDGSIHGTEQEDQVLVPFAIPLVAGPGSITTVITLTATGTGWEGVTTTLGAVLITVLALCLCLLGATRITARLSGRPLRLLTRFMGLILVAIGAQFLLAGFHGFMAVVK